MTTSTASNLVAPSSWALAQLPPASPPQAWTHQVWVDGLGFASKVALAAAFASFLATAPGRQRKSGYRQCILSTNGTWNSWGTTPALV